MWDFISFTNLNPYNPGRGTLSPFTHEETALVKVVTRFSDWESWVLWGAFQDVGSLAEGPMLKRLQSWLRPPSSFPQ